MRISALTTLSLATFLALSTGDATGSARTVRDRGQRTDPVLRGLDGETLGPARTPDTTLGGNYHNPFKGQQGSGDPLPFGVHEVTLRKTGTDWQEKFLVGVPKNITGQAPVLVLFHGYGQTPRKLLELTTYFPDAMARGWIVVAPLSAHIYNFSIDYAQKNTEKVLDWVGMNLPVDPDRFYAVGFSMGGGAAATYAARHLDGNHARFAAVVNHTGTTSVADVYWNSSDHSLLESPLMFGGTPLDFPFRYSNASILDLDTFNGTVDQTTDLGRNLRHVPTKNFCAANDPNTYLVNQTSVSFDQLLSRAVPTEYSESQHTVHKWSTLSETTVLDYLDDKVYQDPDASSPVRTLADRNGRWFHFDVQQRQEGAYSPFRWTVMPAQNRFYLDEVANVDRIGVDPVALGLDRAATVEVVFSNTDGGTVEVVLRGFTQPPSNVLRGGSSTGSWTWDATAGTVTLIESNGGNYPTWKVVP